jgi:hypothetical protein
MNPVAVNERIADLLIVFAAGCLSRAFRKRAGLSLLHCRWQT